MRIGPQRYFGKLIGYDSAATTDSRARMLAFFEQERADSPRDITKQRASHIE